MQGQKTFNIEEARALLPTLRELLEGANAELLDALEIVHTANVRYEKAEQALEESDVAERLEDLRDARAEFQTSIEQLSNAQNAYLSKLNYWIDEITSTGVILRDLRAGLLDFPAEDQGLQYLLCWRMDELDINYWHLETDGFQGRKPLATLSEYCC
jgi:hypothetical protein